MPSWENNKGGKLKRPSQIIHEERLAKLAKIEKLQRKVWIADPTQWLWDRLGEPASNIRWTDFPEYEDHLWDGDIDPLLNAWVALGRKQWASLAAATGTSKTYTAARIILWFLDCFPNSLVVTTAPKQDQLKLNLWSEISRIFKKFQRHYPVAELYKLRLVVDGTEVEELDEEDEYSGTTHQAVGFVAGVGSEEDAANRARGFHRENMLIVIEETPGMPNSVITAFKNTSTAENNVILALGNPDSQHDQLYKFSQLPRVKNYQISAHDYPNVVLNKEIFPGGATRTSLRTMAEDYGENSDMYKRMARGQAPTQSADSLIRMEWIEQCIGKDPVNSPYTGNSYNAVGIDVANSDTGDKGAAAYGMGDTLMYLKDFSCPNATHLAYNLIYTEEELLRKGYSVYHIPTIMDYDIEGDCIGVDAVGVGVATVNAFLDEGYDVQSLQGGQWDEAIPTKEVRDEETYDIRNVPMFRFNSLRSQMYWELREDLRRQHIRIDIEDKVTLAEVCKELTSIRYEAKGNMIQIEAKGDLKKRTGMKSPNKMDAVAYWNWTRKGYRVDRFGYFPILGGTMPR